ncbi:MAG: hypothetical protein M1829_001723 [Trizodia sp. TS-e1964]|nr:MAG: hypothetical protein M1829_001723 [Trizodia sp. TS-e1964]
MSSKRLKLSPKASLPFKSSNKDKRQAMFVKQKKAREALKRDERFRRKRDEDNDPKLKAERLRQNVPLTLDRKRVWDQIDELVEDGLGLSIDAEDLERHRTKTANNEDQGSSEFEVTDMEEGDHDSMLDSGTDDGQGNDESNLPPTTREHRDGERNNVLRTRDSSPTKSTTSTNLDLNPQALVAKFPTLFSSDPSLVPKVLITTSINSNLHEEAHILTSLFPHSVYIPRSAHRYGYKFSVREISSFAVNRKYTAVIVLKEDQKRPTGLTIVHLPSGPTFHFSISNWVAGKKLPRHGNPTGHDPELILNNFCTPLGLLTAHLFRTLFPSRPDLLGRQVVTLHNQRDYIFLRRHRYVFREKRSSEKSVVGPDGKNVKGVEDIRAGLQELGPRFTMKLRRVDKGVGRAGGGQEWEWKARMEKQRTRNCQAPSITPDEWINSCGDLHKLPVSLQSQAVSRYNTTTLKLLLTKNSKAKQDRFLLDQALVFIEQASKDIAMRRDTASDEGGQEAEDSKAGLGTVSRGRSIEFPPQPTPIEIRLKSPIPYLYTSEK